MSYEVVYRLPFTDDLGNTKRLDLLQDDFAGSITEADGVGYSPVFTTFEGQGSDKQRTLWGTELVANLFSKTDFEFLDLLKTASEREFRLELYENSNLKHAGYVIPDSVSEAYQQVPYAVRVGAVSLGALQGIPYKDGSDFYEGRATQMQVIVNCLSKLEFGFDIWDSLNMYEDAMDSASTDSPLTQAEIDQSAFIFNDRGRQKAMNCYDVLEAVLKPYVCNLFQDNGVWKIVPIELRGQSRTVRVFNSSGAFQSSTTHNPEDTTYNWVDGNANVKTLPAIREIVSTYEHGIIENLIEAGDFNGDFYQLDPPNLFFTLPVGWELSDAADFDGGTSRIAVDPDEGGPYGLLLQGQSIEDGGYVVVNPSTVVEFNADDTVRIKIRYAPQVLGAPQEIASIKFRYRIGTRYLQANGAWTATPNDIEILDIGDAQTQVFPGVSGFRDFEFISEPIEADGDVEFRIYKPESSESANNTNCAFAFVQADYYPDGFPQFQSQTFAGERSIDSFSREINYDILFGDGPTNIHKSAITISDSKTENWTRDSISGGLSEVAIRAIASEAQLPYNVITGSQRTQGTFDRYFTDQGTKYIVQYGTYDERKNIIQGDFAEQFESYVAISVSEFNEQQTGSSSGNTSGGQSTSNFDDRYFKQDENLSEGTPSTMRTNLGLVIGTDVQGHSDALDDISLLDESDGNFIVGNGSEWIVESGNTARTSLGLGTGNSPTFAGLTVAGGTSGQLRIANAGATTASSWWWQVRDDGELQLRNNTVTPNSQVIEVNPDTNNVGIGGSALEMLHVFGFLRTPNGYKIDDDVVIDSNKDFFGRIGEFSNKVVISGGNPISEYIINDDSNTAFNLVRDSNLNISGRVRAINLDGTGNADIEFLDWNTALFGQIISPTTDNALDIGTESLQWRDLHLGRNAYVAGGLFVQELVVNTTKVLFDHAISQGGGKISTVTGSTGSEVITFEDADGAEFVPLSVDDIIHIQQRTGVSSGTIVKNIWRKVASIASNDITLTTTGIDWVTGSDVGSIAVGDNVVQKGNTDDTDRQSYVEMLIGGLDMPQNKVWSGVDDVGGGSEVIRVWGLDGFGATGDRGIAGKVGGSLAFEVSETRGFMGGLIFDDQELRNVDDTFSFSNDGIKLTSTEGIDSALPEQQIRFNSGAFNIGLDANEGTGYLSALTLNLRSTFGATQITGSDGVNSGNVRVTDDFEINTPDGLFLITELPTTEPGTPNTVWNDSGTLKITDPPTNPPSTPTGLALTRSRANNAMRIVWNSASGAEDYQLRRSTNEADWTVVYDNTGTQYFDTTPFSNKSTTYFYQIRATNAGGSSSYSSSVSESWNSASNNEALIPKNVSFVFSGFGSDTLSFNQPDSGAPASYNIQYAIDTGAGFGSWNSLNPAYTGGSPFTFDACSLASNGDDMKLRIAANYSNPTETSSFVESNEEAISGCI